MFSNTQCLFLKEGDISMVTIGNGNNDVLHICKTFCYLSSHFMSDRILICLKVEGDR